MLSAVEPPDTSSLQSLQEPNARGQALHESMYEGLSSETRAPLTAASGAAAGAGSSCGAGAGSGSGAGAGAGAGGAPGGALLGALGAMSSLGGVGFGVSAPPLVQCASFDIQSSAGSQTSLNAIMSADGSVTNLLAAAATITSGPTWSAAAASAPSPGLSAEKRTLSDLDACAGGGGRSPEKSKTAGLGRVALGVEKWWKSTEGTSSTAASSTTPPLAVTEPPETHSRRETIGDVPEKPLVYNDPELDIESEMPSADRVIPDSIWKRLEKKEKERQKVLHGTAENMH